MLPARPRRLKTPEVAAASHGAVCLLEWWDAWGQRSLTCPGAHLLSGSEMSVSHAFLGPPFCAPP